MAELIVALDVASAGEAYRLADALPGLRWVKIGPVLFVQEGAGVVREFRARGVRVFLDLKWHDIPDVVAAAVRSAEAIGVELATVHALGGRAMIAGAARAARDLRVAAVSVLTSHEPAGYWEALGREGGALSDEVVRLARVAVEAGARALVASPLEIEAVRQAVGAAPWIVVPGIRPEGAAAHDQRRVAGPAEAARAGATHLVVGRPITRANSPSGVYQRICEEIS